MSGSPDTVDIQSKSSLQIALEMARNDAASPIPHSPAIEAIIAEIEQLNKEDDLFARGRRNTSARRVVVGLIQNRKQIYLNVLGIKDK